MAKLMDMGSNAAVLKQARVNAKPYAETGHTGVNGQRTRWTPELVSLLGTLEDDEDVYVTKRLKHPLIDGVL